MILLYFAACSLFDCSSLTSLLISHPQRFRATLIEIRLHGSSSHWYEVEFASRVLNTTLARSAQARETLKREAIREMVEELVGFCEEVVGAGEGGTPREREE